MSEERLCNASREAIPAGEALDVVISHMFSHTSVAAVTALHRDVLEQARRPSEGISSFRAINVRSSSGMLSSVIDAEAVPVGSPVPVGSDVSVMVGDRV